MSTKSQNARRGRMNFADILILLVFLALVLVLVYVMFLSDMGILDSFQKDPSVKTVSCTLKLSPVDDDLLDSDGRLPVVKGEMLYHVTGKYSLGKVLSVSEKTPYLMSTGQYTKDGEPSLIYREYPGMGVYTISVKAEAELKNGTYYIDGHALRIGDSFEFTTPYFTGSCVVENIVEGVSNGE